MKSIFIYLIGFFCLLKSNVQAQSDSLFYNVKEIKIGGNKRTNDRVILREMGIKVNDKTYKTAIDSLRKKSEILLFNTSLFTSVSIWIETKENDAIVHVYLQERLYAFVQPNLELGDRNFTEFTERAAFNRFSYGLRGVINNIEGNRQNMKINSLLGFTKKISFDYEIPYLTKDMNWGIGVNYTYKTNYETWYATKNDRLVRYSGEKDDVIKRNYYSVYLSYRKSFFTYNYFGVQVENSKVADTISKYLNPSFFYTDESKLISNNFYYQYLIEKRNQKYYPTNGYYFSVKPMIHYLPFQHVFLPTISLEYKKYIPLKERFTYAIMNSFQISTSKNIPYYYYQSLGYDRSLRGYELYVIDGKNLALVQQHIAFNILKQRNLFLPINFLKKFKSIPISTYIRLVFDAAYVSDNQFQISNTLRNKIIYSTGIGLDIVTYYDKVLRFDFSYLSNGKIGGYLSLKRSL